MQPVRADALGAMLTGLGGAAARISTIAPQGTDLTVIDWRDVHVRVRHAKRDDEAIGVRLVVLLGDFDTLDARLSTERLLEDLAGTSQVRLVVRDPMLELESVLLWDEIDAARADKIFGARLDELATLACTWRTRYGVKLADDVLSRSERLAALAVSQPLAALKRTVLPPEHALRVAAAAFGVAASDGQITNAERDKLRGWLADIPAFASLDPGTVVRAIADLVTDPGKHLMEASRKLDDPGLLLAWSLACEMAHADGTASNDAQSYLANVATVFRMPPAAVASLTEQAREAATRRRTGNTIAPAKSA